MKKILKEYILWTYGVFWCLLLLTGLVIFVIKSQVLAEIFKVISAWTPTLVFIAMFHKINPKGNLRDYVKSQFGERIKMSTVLCIVLFQVIIFIGSVLILNHVGKNVQLVISSTTLVLLFGDHLIRGPLGEEVGWRGYLLNELQKRFNPLASGIIVGLIWGFWHAPLWFISSGYSGIQLLKYIICFLISILALSVIITVFYNINHNLMMPMIIHQLFNYLMGLQIGDRLQIFAVTALLYSVMAVIMGLINYKKCLYE